MAKDYDIGAAFEAIEEELIQSMMRNMKDHRVEEDGSKMQWEMWQAKQLDALERYKKKNRKRYKDQFHKINSSIDRALNQAYVEGGMEQEIEILKSIKKRYGDNPTANARRIKNALAEKLPFGSRKGKDFFQVNDERLDALIHATTNDMKKAESAMLRMADDQYRKIIFNAQVYAATGAGTYEKAVDMATKDFLAAGINCIEYKDGRRVNIKSYARMAIRTADKRARLYADGKVRQKLGIHTVITKKRLNACPKCLPFVDRILIDDVWSGGTPEDGPYMLLSEAMAAGFLHPNCKDHFSTYMPGITDPPEGGFTEDEIREVEQGAKQEAAQKYAGYQSEKYERLAKYSLDEDNKREYERKSKEWNVAKSANSGIMKLPRYEEAIIPESKFNMYALNPDKDPDKARAFKEALGYDLSNYHDLIADIRQHLPECEALEKPDNGHGRRYEVVMSLTGPNGKTADVLTAWIDDMENGEMRLTTAHIDRRRKGGKNKDL